MTQLRRPCPDQNLCVAGDGCAGRCSSEQPMQQFYTSTHSDARYLVERRQDLSIPAGEVVARLA